ncbi:hypothetical protein F4813DRAFT_297008 [Daldinia decipiens]|uniref:uncharacterized protein n=1 Tax=Daldinia decipiens TaxID=326647 RepID=UPI0020C430AC|nr:uncharacterized protein F4813DRAFT_297008 [Daldinia decipiens]KAI1660526.1 hypothetical protein F4813DRAFT_297008 [Daldinia decipiens]
MKLHSFTSSELILKGIAVSAHVSAMGPEYKLRLTSQLRTERYLMPVHIQVSITWDENVSVMAANPDEWLRLQEERKQELLFMGTTYSHIKEPRYMSDIQGLVLRRVYCLTNQDSFVRIGRFCTDDMIPFKRYIARLKELI